MQKCHGKTSNDFIFIRKTLTGRDDANNNESVKKTVVKDQNTALYEHAMLYTHTLKKAKHPRASTIKKYAHF